MNQRQWSKALTALHHFAKSKNGIYMSAPLSLCFRGPGHYITPAEYLGCNHKEWGADRILWASDFGVVRITEDGNTVEDVSGVIHLLPAAMIPAYSWTTLWEDNLRQWGPVSADYNMILPRWQVPAPVKIRTLKRQELPNQQPLFGAP